MLRVPPKRPRPPEYYKKKNEKQNAERRFQKAIQKEPDTIVHSDFTQLKRARKMDVIKILKADILDLLGAYLPNTSEIHYPSILQEISKSPREERHISSTIDLIKNAMKKDGKKNMTLDNQNIIMQLGSLLLDSMEKPTRKSFEELLGN